MPTRTCIITGASRGIGLATALRFAKDGYAVVAAARDPGELAAASRQIQAARAECETVALDMAVPENARRLIDAAVRRFGRVDVLVNNAGCAPLGPIDEISAAEFEQTYRLNIAAVFHTTQAVWPVLKRQGGGVIVNISSAASVDPFPGFAVYGASKAWVNLFSQAVAAEGQPLGIRVFAVAPGAVETKLMRSAFPDFPADRTLAPEEVAAVVRGLCDETWTRCSGQTIFVRK
mgnify:CR=1 FL=1